MPGITEYKEGQSGNLDGRPKGSKNVMTELREQFAKAAPKIVTQVLKLAFAGDEGMIKLAMERMMPKRREETYVSIPNFKGGDYKSKCNAIEEALHEEIISVEIAKIMSEIVNRRFEIEVLRTDNKRLHQELVEIKEVLKR